MVERLKFVALLMARYFRIWSGSFDAAKPVGSAAQQFDRGQQAR
jgi:hypothetical protein